MKRSEKGIHIGKRKKNRYLLNRWKPVAHQEPFETVFFRNGKMIDMVRDDQEATRD
jgi:hypothetical protein